MKLVLKPLDIVVGLKAHLWKADSSWSFERIAASIGITASQAHTSLRRLGAAGLYRPQDRSLRTHAFRLFAEHGIPFAFPASPAGDVLGMPTSHSAPPLRDRLASVETFVWPAPEGVLGRAVLPLDPRVPRAAAIDEALYRALALLDAFRVGRARDRAVAREELDRLLEGAGRDGAWLAAQRTAGLAS